MLSVIQQTFIMLFIKSKSNQYVNSKGNAVFIYIVASNAVNEEDKLSELADYTASQGPNYRESESAEPFYFSTAVCPIGAELVLGQKAGRYSVQSDLEARVEEARLMKAQAAAKYAALMEICGVTAAQLRAQMFAV